MMTIVLIISVNAYVVHGTGGQVSHTPYMLHGVYISVQDSCNVHASTNFGAKYVGLHGYFYMIAEVVHEMPLRSRSIPSGGTELLKHEYLPTYSAP
jgi:hypothetical protein